MGEIDSNAFVLLLLQYSNAFVLLLLQYSYEAGEEYAHLGKWKPESEVSLHIIDMNGYQAQ